MQLAQSLHVSLEFFYKYPDITKNWIHNSNYLICLSVKDMGELIALASKAKERNILYVEFHEPDLNNELTALCFEPTIEANKLCSYIPLALKTKKYMAHV